MPKSWTKEEFISKSKAIHGEDAFDYSKVVYVNSTTDVTLICKQCGEDVIVSPDKHINRKKGCNCQSSHPKRSYIEFKNIMVTNHNDYWNSFIVLNENELLPLKRREFLMEKTPIHLKCKQCGFDDWFTNGKRLMNENACPRCTGKVDRSGKFIEEFKSKQPEIFENIEILGEFVSGKTPILVRCKKCGHEWRPQPDNLKNGKSKCKCMGGKIAKHTNETIQEALEKTSWEYVDDSHFRCRHCGEIAETSYKTLLTQGIYCPSCDDRARWHTAFYWEKKIKDKFGEDLSFQWESNKTIKNKDENLIVFRDGQKVVSKKLNLILDADVLESKNLSIDEAKAIAMDNLRNKEFTLLDNLEDVTNQSDSKGIKCRCNTCNTISSFRLLSIVHNTFGCKCCQYTNNRKKPRIEIFNNEEYTETIYGSRVFTDGNINQEIIDWITDKSNFWMVGVNAFIKDDIINIAKNESVEDSRYGCSIYVSSDAIPSFIKFGTVEGYFSVFRKSSYNGIVNNLRGCPEKIIGKFDCSDISLQTLQFGPIFIYGDYVCSKNNIKDFDNTEFYIKGNFWCDYNHINDDAFERFDENKHLIEGKHSLNKNNLVKYE